MNWGKSEILQTDNGKKIYGEFGAYLNTNYITHVRGRINHPQSQGSVEALNKTLKIEISDMFRRNSEGFDIEQALKDFLVEYNTCRQHSSTQVIPAILFSCKNEEILEKVQKRLVTIKKYQKQIQMAIKRLAVALLSHYKIDNSDKINFIKSQEPRRVIALGVLFEDLLTNYARVKIEKSLTNAYHLEMGVVCDPRYVYSLEKELWNGLL